MAEKRTYTCDICGAEKRETNHWFAIFVIPASYAPPSRIYIVSLLDLAKTGNEGNAMHLCGEACVLKAMSQNLAKLLPPAMEGPAN